MLTQQVKVTLHPHTWKIQGESKPLNAPKGVQNIGGINHNCDAFSNSRLNSKDYNCPFVDLFLSFQP
jgi:hypothetical protein